MAENSAIEWTDHTFNPWRGCTKVSPGCKHCYADQQSKRNPGTLGVWGPNGSRVVAAESYWKQPLKWDREAEAAGERRRVFCASMADVFEAWDGPMVDSQERELYLMGDGRWLAPEMKIGRDRRPLTMDDIRRRLFALIDATPNLDWILLTKRPENVGRMMPKYWRTTPSENWFFDPEDQKRRGLTHAGPHIGTMSVSGIGVVRHNLWLGTSVENQAAADERIPHLLRVPAAVRFLSCEPLLGPVDLSAYLNDCRCGACDFCVDLHGGGGNRIDWIIVGGESGPKARPMHPDWARDIRDQCQAAGVPFFFKQWGEWAPWTRSFNREVSPVDLIWIDPAGATYGLEQSDAVSIRRVGKKSAGRLLDGREWSEFPAMSMKGGE